MAMATVTVLGGTNAEVFYMNEDCQCQCQFTLSILEVVEVSTQRPIT